MSSTVPLEGNLQLAVQALLLRSQEHAVLTRVAVSVVVALVSWRIWKFTIYPMLHPNEPKELPTWIPVLGHGVSFFHNCHALLLRACNHFGNSREPFAITAVGIKFYVITDPKQTVEVYKTTESLSFEEFLVGLMKYLGLTTNTLTSVFHTRLPADKPGFPNPGGKPLGYFVRNMHHHQLFPGENLDQLEVVMLGWFERHLDVATLKSLCAPYATFSSSTDSSSSSFEVPLVKFCSELFTRAGEEAYFGDTLAQLEPDMATAFLEYDERSWQVLHQYPRVFSRKMHAAMDRIQAIFMRYFQVPQAERHGDAWFTKAIENECRALGISEPDMARFMVMIYWVTNTRKAAFWMLYWLMRNPALLEAVREETAPAFGSGNLVDKEHIHKHSPVLERVWFETLRMSSNSASARVITRDTVVGGRLLRKGAQILIPYRLLHFNEAVFGADVDSFRPDRFADRRGASHLTMGPSWRPFGGGQTKCPGHFVAKRETMLFAALVLRRFDVEMVDPQTAVLEVDLGKPVLGLADRKEGQDVMVRFTPRNLE